MWWKRNKWKVLIPLLIAAVLCAAFFLGGKQPEQPAQALPEQTPETPEVIAPEPIAEPEPTAEQPEPVTEPEPAKAPEPQPEAKPSCTISIRCDTLLQNPELIDPEKAALVPDSGVLLPETKVELQADDTVFTVLKRACMENAIHMEFSETPMYESAYIEGIGNLYEFDAGELSGWMYKVNGVFPNFGCSKYTLSDGDVIVWVYTCDLGADVGGGGWQNGA